MRRVLVADDDPDIRAAAEAALVGAGYQVFLAENGRRAIQAAESTEFHALVSDYSMPPPNGVEVLETVRRLQPACVGILCSGQLDLPVIAEAVNRGEISRVLPKPVSGSALVAAVGDALRSRGDQTRSFSRRSEQHEQTEVRRTLRECLDGMAMLALQPFVLAGTTTRVGYEALLRSKHPILRGPMDVILAAERADGVHDLGDAVMRLARARLDRLEPGQVLFLNLHPQELGDPARFRARLEPLAPDSKRVVLEITERSDLADTPGWQESLALIRALGFRVAVDDLGAGYSSLSALARIKPEFMKIDMSIVRGVDADAHKRQLIELLAAFARATGATLIAEGVETQAEADALVACGANWLQGYFFGRPQV